MHIRSALFHNIFWRLGGFVCTFATNILVVRLLGANASGQLYYFLAWLTFMITFFRFGLENGITYIATKNPSMAPGLVRALVPLTLIQLFAIAWIIYYSPEKGLTFHTHIASIFVFANVVMYYLFAFYSSAKLFRVYNLINTIFAAVQTILFACIYYSGRWTFIGIDLPLADLLFRIMGWAAALNVLVLMIMYFIIKPKISEPKTAVSKLLYRKLFQYSGLNFFSNLLLFILIRADFYFVEKYCEPVVMGNYVQAAKIGQMLLLVPGMIGGVIFPYAINAGEEMVKKIVYLCKVLAVCFCVAYIGLLLAGKWVFPWMLGAEFDYVYHMMILLVPGVFFAAINLLLISYFEAKNSQWTIFLTNALTVIVLLAIDFFFVKSFGYKAAAIAFTFANFIATLIFTMKFRSVTSQSLKSLFGIRSLMKESL